MCVCVCASEQAKVRTKSSELVTSREVRDTSSTCMRWRRKKTSWRFDSKPRKLRNQKMNTLISFRESSLDEQRFRSRCVNRRRRVNSWDYCESIGDGDTTGLMLLSTICHEKTSNGGDLSRQRDTVDDELTATTKCAASRRGKLRSPNQTSRAHPSKTISEGES
jgi:hypothetical protein